MSQKLPVRNFKLVKNMSKLDEDFMKNYDEMLDFFLMWILNILKNYMIYIAIHHFSQKE